MSLCSAQGSRVVDHHLVAVGGVPETCWAVGPQQWRSSELIGDHVQLKEGVRYACVRDLIVSYAGRTAPGGDRQS